MAGGGLSGRERGDLATSSVELVSLVRRRQASEMCYSSRDRPGEQRGQSQTQTHAQPHGSRCHMAAPELSASEETQASASRVTAARVHVMLGGGLLSRQAGSLPSSPVPPLFLPGRLQQLVCTCFV